MKQFVALLLASFLVISLTACAGGSAKQSVRVKCPACGYEFDSGNN